MVVDTGLGAEGDDALPSGMKIMSPLALERVLETRRRSATGEIVGTSEG